MTDPRKGSPLRHFLGRRRCYSTSSSSSSLASQQLSIASTSSGSSTNLAERQVRIEVGNRVFPILFQTLKDSSPFFERRLRKFGGRPLKDFSIKDIDIHDERYFGMVIKYIKEKDVVDNALEIFVEAFMSNPEVARVAIIANKLECYELEMAMVDTFWTNLANANVVELISSTFEYGLEVLVQKITERICDKVNLRNQNHVKLLAQLSMPTFGYFIHSYLKKEPHVVWPQQWEDLLQELYLYTWPIHEAVENKEITKQLRERQERERKHPSLFYVEYYVDGCYDIALERFVYKQKTTEPFTNMKFLLLDAVDYMIYYKTDSKAKRTMLMNYSFFNCEKTQDLVCERVERVAEVHVVSTRKFRISDIQFRDFETLDSEMYIMSRETPFKHINNVKYMTQQYVRVLLDGREVPNFFWWPPISFEPEQTFKMHITNLLHRRKENELRIIFFQPYAISKCIIPLGEGYSMAFKVYVAQLEPHFNETTFKQIERNRISRIGNEAVIIINKRIDKTKDTRSGKPKYAEEVIVNELIIKGFMKKQPKIDPKICGDNFSNENVNPPIRFEN